MSQKILCVDDDPNILQGYKRALRKEFDITTAEGGELGLMALKNEGPFAIVISDMRMPGMDGVQFLSKVKDLVPHTVRIMLTGNSDQQTAMDAVNEGNIFRFLTKPCPPEVLSKTLNAGLEQYQLHTAEKQLLEETLNNSLQVMVDILSMVNPTAFSRSNRIKTLARELAHSVNVKNQWEIDIAAMLSLIGCITVPEETLVKVNKGIPLTAEEANLYQQHPQVAYELVSRIPRLEIVAAIIAQQQKSVEEIDPPNPNDPDSVITAIGAKILKVVIDYDRQLITNHSPQIAFSKLSENSKCYDAEILAALQKLIDIGVEEKVIQVLSVRSLKPGMLLAEALTSTRGELLLAVGQELTLSLILRLNTFASARIINPTVTVLTSVPVIPIVSSNQMAG